VCGIETPAAQIANTLSESGDYNFLTKSYFKRAAPRPEAEDSRQSADRRNPTDERTKAAHVPASRIRSQDGLDGLFANPYLSGR
jgi:hypothetical protein